MVSHNPFVYDPYKNEEITNRLKKVESILDGFVDGVLPALKTKLGDSSSSKGNVSLFDELTSPLLFSRSPTFISIVRY